MSSSSSSISISTHGAYSANKWSLGTYSDSSTLASLSIARVRTVASLTSAFAYVSHPQHARA